MAKAKKTKTHKDDKYVEDNLQLGIKSSSKTDPKNISKVRFRDFGPEEERVIDYVTTNKKPVTVKQIAIACFNGDYLKAKNMVRRPRWSGRIAMGPGLGEYSAP